MQRYYLKARTETELWTSLHKAGLAHKKYNPDDPANKAPDELDAHHTWDGPSGDFEWTANTDMLDIIGPIYTRTGNMLTDPHGNEYPETRVVEGYHANLTETLTDAQLAFLPTISTPATPYRK